MSRGLQSKPHFYTQSHMLTFCASVSQEIFESSNLPGHQVCAWKELLLKHAKHGKFYSVLEAFRQLNLLNFPPNGYVFVSVIKACANQCAYLQGKFIHSQVVDCSFESNLFIGSSLINFYFVSGSPEDAQNVFDGLQRHDIVIWNAMIAGYAQHGRVEKMLELYQKMQTADSKPNINTWNALIGGCAHNKLSEEALQFFKQMMQEGYMPKDVTFASVLNACTKMAAQDHGKVVHVYVIENRLSSDIFLGNTLINLYVKCRNFMLAHAVFERLPKQDCVTWNALISGYSLHGNCSEALELFHDMQKKGHSPDLVTWNALLTGHLQHGHAEEVLLLFQQMDEQGRKPDSITVVSVLKACSLMAASKQGKLIHAYLLETDLISDLFVCNALIDMYAKCGSLQGAYNVFKLLPKRDMVSWNTIIAAFSVNNRYEAMFQCVENMQLQGFQPDEVTFLSILSACARAGLVDPGGAYSISMLRLHSICAKPEQYSSMLDLLGREGFLQEAERLLELASIKDNVQAWSSLLGHCRTYGDVRQGRQCFDQILTLDDRCSSAYELMAALYADRGMWENVAHIQGLQRRAEEARRSTLKSKKARCIL